MHLAINPQNIDITFKMFLRSFFKNNLNENNIKRAKHVVWHLPKDESGCFYMPTSQYIDGDLFVIENIVCQNLEHVGQISAGNLAMKKYRKTNASEPGFIITGTFDKEDCQYVDLICIEIS